MHTNGEERIKQVKTQFTAITTRRGRGSVRLSKREFLGLQQLPLVIYVLDSMAERAHSSRSVSLQVTTYENSKRS